MAPSVQTGLVTRPKAKIDRLRAEAIEKNCGQLTAAGDIAAALGIKPNTFSEWFGSNADTHGSRPPHRHLTIIVSTFCAIGVYVETDWFFEDYDEFASCVTAARGKRPARPIHDIDPSPSTDQWEVADANNISQHSPRCISTRRRRATTRTASCCRCRSRWPAIPMRSRTCRYGSA